MRIGIDGLPLTESLAGVGHYTFEIARHIARSFRDDEVDIISPKPFISSIVSPPDANSHLRLSCKEVNLLTRRWWSIGLPRYLKQGRFDVFHGTNFEVPLQAVCPTVLTIHDLSLLLYPETHVRRSVWRARGRLPLMARRATMIITVSEAVREEVHEHLRIPLEKIATVYSAAREQFRPLDDESARLVRERLNVTDEFVLYAGTIEPRKNLSFLVQAFAEVLREGRPDLQLVLAGKKGWLVEDLYHCLRQCSAAKNVMLTGYLNDEQLCALYSSCKLFVYPSLYEGFGLPPLEAMACGAPVIASRIPSISEVVGSAARLVSPHSVTELVKAMNEMLEDDSLRESYRKAGEERVRRFSWPLTADGTHAVYVEAISRFSHSRRLKL